jgi:hypothetical protein
MTGASGRSSLWITASVVSLEKRIPDAAAFARGLVFGNPLREQILARGGDPEQCVHTVVEELQREFGADPGCMALQAIMFSAGKPPAL